MSKPGSYPGWFIPLQLIFQAGVRCQLAGQRVNDEPTLKVDFGMNHFFDLLLLVSKILFQERVILG